mgnify:CR=1 FL=1
MVGGEQGILAFTGRGNKGKVNYFGAPGATYPKHQSISPGKLITSSPRSAPWGTSRWGRGRRWPAGSWDSRTVRRAGRGTTRIRPRADPRERRSWRRTGCRRAARSGCRIRYRGWLWFDCSSTGTSGGNSGSRAPRLGSPAHALFPPGRGLGGGNARMTGLFRAGNITAHRNRLRSW